MNPNEKVSMNPLHQRPQPLYGSTVRPHCPVCGHVSYSAAGIHPQCAMRIADQIQMNRVKSRNAAKAKIAAKPPGKFEKHCPKCRTVHHIRKHACECGHSFLFKSEQIPAG